MIRWCSLQNYVACVIAAACALLNPQATATTIAQDQRTQPDDIVLARPTRRAPDAAPAPAPELPPAAENITPLTLEVVIRREAAAERPHTVRQTVSRTADRVHMKLGGGREWLFERNAVDRRRVAGLLVIHATRTIVLHEESDLRNMLGLNGWADVLMLGLDSAVLGQLAPSSQTRTMAGVRFVKYKARGKDVRMSDVWWSQQQALPSGFVVRDAAGQTRVSVERIRMGVKGDLLRSPSSRFPDYTVVDVAQWLEGL